ncbi:MAG: hypothetical protein AAGA12_00540 [Pseudomonadota bacterium]
MKTFLTAASAALLFAGTAYADGHIDVQALLAMSNNSAAEIMVSETSMGDLTAAQVSLALGNMSAAERQVFFEADQSSRLQIIEAQMKLLDGDSAAESN